MINPAMIPDEVVWKLQDKLWRMGGASTDETRAAIAAALSAWPGSSMEHRETMNFGNNIDGPIVGVRRVPFVILPLPTGEA